MNMDTNRELPVTCGQRRAGAIYEDKGGITWTKDTET